MTRGNRNRLLSVFGAAVVWLSALAFAAPERAFAQAAAGSVTVSSGQVQIQRGGATLPGNAGIQVNVGDRVITGAGGHAVIVLADQSHLELGPASAINIDQLNGAGSASTHVSLFSGVLRSIVNATGGATNYEVHTPNAVAAVRGTRFDTAYSEGAVRPFYDGCSRYTDVSVYEGTVNLASTNALNAGEDVGAGYEATVPCQLSPVPAGPLAMTGAASFGGGSSTTSGFAGSMPGASGAPSPACPVCSPNTPGM
jgi:hypothetical protein